MLRKDRVHRFFSSRYSQVLHDLAQFKYIYLSKRESYTLVSCDIIIHFYIKYIFNDAVHLMALRVASMSFNQIRAVQRAVSTSLRARRLRQRRLECVRRLLGLESSLVLLVLLLSHPQGFMSGIDRGVCHSRRAFATGSTTAFEHVPIYHVTTCTLHKYKYQSHII